MSDSFIYLSQSLYFCFSSLIAVTMTSSTVLNRLVIHIVPTLVLLLILEVGENFSVFHSSVQSGELVYCSLSIKPIYVPGQNPICELLFLYKLLADLSFSIFVPLVLFVTFPLVFVNEIGL